MRREGRAKERTAIIVSRIYSTYRGSQDTLSWEIKFQNFTFPMFSTGQKFSK